MKKRKGARGNVASPTKPAPAPLTPEHTAHPVTTQPLTLPGPSPTDLAQRHRSVYRRHNSCPASPLVLVLRRHAAFFGLASLGYTADPEYYGAYAMRNNPRETPSALHGHAPGWVPSPTERGLAPPQAVELKADKATADKAAADKAAAEGAAADKAASDKAAAVSHAREARQVRAVQEGPRG